MCIYRFRHIHCVSIILITWHFKPFFLNFYKHKHQKWKQNVKLIVLIFKQYISVITIYHALLITYFQVTKNFLEDDRATACINHNTSRAISPDGSWNPWDPQLSRRQDNHPRSIPFDDKIQGFCDVTRWWKNLVKPYDGIDFNQLTDSLSNTDLTLHGWLSLKNQSDCIPIIMPKN